MTQVTTPKGSVTYSYYANGLRQGMTVAGQPALAYTYDAGDRLTRIDQAAGAANNNVAQNVSFTYDAAGRRLRTTYMNGVTRENSYDDGGQLMAITYKNPDGSTLGDLAYTYDDGGRRTGVTGSLARTALPDALPNANVDAANRLTVSGPQSLTYDANGNLTGDGSQTYVWNARDQLVQIRAANDAVIASFTYDALGRRQTKTVGGVASGYVYDGANIVQELAGSEGNKADPIRVKANYIAGGIDEVFAQQGGSGTGATTLMYLTDALWSTVRLVDAAGAKVVDYTYDPYGNTSADAAVDNPFQYTGRENDGTGLYYYRARHYSPKLARFISSDPIGINGGINTYAYVSGNPLSRIDPFGLDWFRSLSDQSSPYVVGRSGNFFVPPGGLVSKAIEHCVPAGRTFGELHDTKVDDLSSKGVPDWRANIPTMPETYWEAIKQEGGKSMQQLQDNLLKLSNISLPGRR